jgi:hypothetical protein
MLLMFFKSSLTSLQNLYFSLTCPSSRPWSGPSTETTLSLSHQTSPLYQWWIGLGKLSLSLSRFEAMSTHTSEHHHGTAILKEIAVDYWPEVWQGRIGLDKLSLFLSLSLDLRQCQHTQASIIMARRSWRR